MRFAFVFALMAMVFLAGCTSQIPSLPPGQNGTSTPGKTCHMESSKVPVTKEECGPVSYTEPVCGLRKLNYSMGQVAKIDLCIADTGCTGAPLGDCQACTKAMTRCVLTIKNEEPQKSGVWKVGANYSLSQTIAFIKDPITKEIRPNESFAFDFNQIYNPGQPINSADCSLFVTEEPYSQDCHDETRTRNECKNVTTTETVQTQVCE
ncbi:MAG TPA: hypothetical protein VLD37_00815 [Candidatus Bilamarchaeum sp.]|nr:hypothetical protein [Candidatus Bilamarchaeum sp.]